MRATRRVRMWDDDGRMRATFVECCGMRPSTVRACAGIRSEEWFASCAQAKEWRGEHSYSPTAPCTGCVSACGRGGVAVESRTERARSGRMRSRGRRTLVCHWCRLYVIAMTRTFASDLASLYVCVPLLSGQLVQSQGGSVGAAALLAGGCCGRSRRVCVVVVCLAASPSVGRHEDADAMRAVTAPQDVRKTKDTRRGTKGDTRSQGRTEVNRPV